MKEKLIILGITTGIFLPVRIIFASYVSEHWLGSLGAVSAIGLFFVYLIKKQKLGWFGEMFERQMRKTLGGKTGKYVIIFSIVFLVYFGASLYFMDKGNTVYFHDKEIFYNALIANQNLFLETIPIEKLEGPNLLLGANELSFVSNVDYAMSIAFSIMNDSTEGWLSHLVVVIFVEQLEILGLIFFLRSTYRKKPTAIREKN